MMNKIRLNGAEDFATSALNLTDLVAEVIGIVVSPQGQAEDGQKLGIAVAHNGEVVPRTEWFTTHLTTGDEIEILAAIQGG
jgi:sulfur carrier protein